MRNVFLAVMVAISLSLLFSCLRETPPAAITVPETSPAALADTCAPAGYTYIDYSDNRTAAPEVGIYRLDKIIWGPFSLYIFGSAGQSEGAKLQAQLYQGERAVDWWGFHNTRLENGRWEFSLKANEFDGPEELPEFGPGYSLWIWNIDNPIVTARLSLDSPGPLRETVIPGQAGLAPTSLEGSRWTLVSINGTKLIPGTEITLQFKDGRATGMSDCNSYGGKYQTRAPNLINISELITTELSCGELSDRQSEEYGGLLRNAICYRVADDWLELYDVITNNMTLDFEKSMN